MANAESPPSSARILVVDDLSRGDSRSAPSGVRGMGSSTVPPLENLLMEWRIRVT